jgi:hypothetical protein
MCFDGTLCLNDTNYCSAYCFAFLFLFTKNKYGTNYNEQEIT